MKIEKIDYNLTDNVDESFIIWVMKIDKKYLIKINKKNYYLSDESK